MEKKTEHRSLDDLRKIQQELLNHPETPKNGEIYRHYKGNKYIVLGIAIREADEAPIVQYVGEKNQDLLPWLRPLVDWNSLAEHEGKPVKRFTKISTKTIWQNMWDKISKIGFDLMAMRTPWSTKQIK